MSTNKTIAKNTLFLYFRMMLVMGVSLYTSRIVLRELGVSDYGIYSLVGGFVALFAFLSGAMSGATQRYLTYDIGSGNFEKLKKTFSITLSIHIGIALLVFLIAETIGLWYVNSVMVFPVERQLAVNIVYQFSIAASLLGIIQVPYDALIIAREKMNIYAYVSIAEVLLKLLIVFLLVYLGKDKLITYSILTFGVALIIRLFYQFYCRKHYLESHYKFVKDPKYYKELISYSSWNLIGSVSVVAKGQGTNLVLNLFFGTTVNAAYGIMNTVVMSVNSFIKNFQMASNPQIIKLYAKGDIGAMQKLINQTSKFTFFLSLLVMLPFFINTDYVLHLWLGNPPKYAAILIRLALLSALVDSISSAIMIGVTATGKIRLYHIIVGGLNLLNLPISYLLIKYSSYNEPQTIIYVWLVLSFVLLFFRVFLLSKLTDFSFSLFVKKVIFRIILVSGCSSFIIYVLVSKLKVDSFFSLALQTVISSLLVVFVIAIVGVEKSEKSMYKAIFNKIIKRK